MPRIVWIRLNKRLLLASALELGCSHFLPEDLQDGQQIGGLTIINPFLHAPEAILGLPQD
jgi:predicted nucleic acid-binding protein